MKDRILTFLQNENKSYAQFAEEIGVQPSGISHILSGRNNPSLDFVTKMLHRYPSLSADWLLFGRTPMYKYTTQPTLFDNEAPNIGSEEGKATQLPQSPEKRTDASVEPEKRSYDDIPVCDEKVSDQKRLIRVLLIYSDKTFTEFNPS